MDLVVAEGRRKSAVVSGLRLAADHETREKQEDGAAAESHHTPAPGTACPSHPSPRQCSRSGGL